METHSSLPFRRRHVGSCIAIALLAVASVTNCGSDDTSTPGSAGGTGGSGGAGGSPDAGGDAVVDAPPSNDTSTTSDAPRSDVASDGSSVDRTNGSDTSSRDGATIPDGIVVADAGTRNDAANDTNVADKSSSDAGSIDTGHVDTPITPGDGSTPACALCVAYGASKLLGKVTTSSLNNLSGITVSRVNTSVLYVHNDLSSPQYFALSAAAGSEATLLGTFTLTGVTVVDIEDMATAPCGTGTCVYLADIGGNTSARTEFSIVRAPEPSVQIGQLPVTQSIAAEKLTFKYPDGANHNAESLLVDPTSGTVYVITKVAAGMPSTVYRLGSTFGGATVNAEKIVDLTVPASSDKEATSASAHPCEPAFLLRTYNTLYEFRAPAGSPFEAAFQATPVVVPAATETQAEGVAYGPDGLSYYTTTEGASPPINVVGCQ